MRNEQRNNLIDELFTEQESALIWAALLAYDVGPEEANPKIFKELTELKEYLIELFE